MFDYVDTESGKGVLNSHICNIYQNDDERLSVLTSFVLSGIENNEKCVIIIHADQQEQLLKELQKYIEIDNYLDSHQVELLSVEEFFLEGGSFSPYRVIIKLKEKASNLISQDLSKMRIVGEMTWLLTYNKILPSFFSFEHYISELCMEDNCLFLDQFDKNKIDYPLLTDIITIHSIAIIGTRVFNRSIRSSEKKKIQNPETSKDLQTILEILEFKRAKDLHIWNTFCHREESTLIFSEDGTIFDYNASMERLTGYRKEEIKDLKSWFFQLIPEKKNQNLILAILKYSEKTRDNKIEVEILRKDGEKRWVKFTVDEVSNSDFPTTFQVLRGDDITLRKMKEKQLLFHARLLESVQESIVAINLNKTILYWGKGAEALYGYQSDEVLGAPITIIFPDQEKEEEIQRIKKTIEINSWKGQTKQKRKNGEEFWAGSRISLVKDQKGYPCGFVRIDVDISGYKEKEEELEVSEQKFRNIFNSSPMGMLEYQLMEDGRLVFVGANPAAEEILKVGTDQFIGKTIEEAFPPLSQTDIPDNYRRVAQTGQEWRLNQITYEDSQIKGIYEVVAFQTEPMKMVASFQDKTASELAKKKFLESEKKYQSLVTNMPGVTWVSTSDGLTTFISKNINEVYGYSPEEIYQNGEDLWFNRIHPDDLEEVKQKFKNIFENDEPFDIEYRIKRSDNKYIWLHDRGLMVYEEGKEKFVYGVFFDITDQKKAENLLQSSEEKYRNLFNNANDALYLFEISSSGELGSFIEVNDIACQRLGYTKEEFLEMTPFDIKTRTESLKLRKIVGNISFQEQKPFETVHLSKSGKKIPVEINSHFFSLNGKRVGFSVSRDITNRKKVEEKLQQAKNKYQLLIENMQEGVILEDTDGKFTFVNKKTSNMLGYHENEIYGKNWNLIVPNDELTALEREFKNISSGLNYSFESILLTKQGEHLPVIINTTPVYSDSESLSGFLSVLTDISILKQAELDRTNFVTMTSHELRTPLTVIRGSSEFLYDHYENINQDQRQKCLRTVLRNINRLERLINGVLETSKIENNNFHIEFKKVDICIFLRIQEKMYKTHLKDQIKFHQPPSYFNTYVNADQDRLRFVFDNLIENAVKHTSKESREIIVRTEIHPDLIQISVADNGAGISSENIKKIFKQFVTVPSKYSVNGTGIGLFISQETMVAHGGSLTVKSDGIDCGAIFTLTLPRISDENLSNIGDVKGRENSSSQ